MADVDMELDIAPQPVQEVQADEDLIDYDSDAAEPYQSMDADLPHEDTEMSGADDAASPTDFMQQDVESIQDVEASELLQEDHHVEMTHDEHPNGVVNPAMTPPTAQDLTSLDEPNGDDVDFFNADDADEGQDADMAVEHFSVAEDNNEIDYDHEEVRPDESGEAETGDIATHTNSTAHADEAKNGDPSATAETELHEADDAQQAEPDALDDEPEQDEITWEQHEGDSTNEGELEHLEVVDEVADAETEDANPEEAAADDIPTALVEQDKEAEAEPLLETENNTHGDANEEAVSPTAAASPVGKAAEDDVGGEVGDRPATPQEAAHTQDINLPAVTVQYKGDEFPLFSLGSEGFFSETSIAESSMESLLAGLREELMDEISPEEDLVLQVDELGLEFVESNLRESLSGVTLNQILEIFDLLVKNQDPDNTRTLYIYLFTKPNPSKRYELLAESAAAGKGLDEVVHLFEPPMGRNTSLVAALDASEAFDEHLESYDSVDENEPQDTSYGEEEDLDEEIAGQHEEHDADPTGLSENGDNKTSHDGAAEAHESTEVGETAIAETENQASDSHDANDLEHNAFLNFDLEEPVIPNNDEPDLEQDPPVRDDTDTGTSATERVADTSATSTLQDDAEPLALAGDLDFAAAENGDIPDEDELAEIDWRDDAEAISSTIAPEASEDAPPGTGKRARPEEEPAVANEKGIFGDTTPLSSHCAHRDKDVKRRRS